MSSRWSWLALGVFVGVGCAGDGEQEVTPKVQELTERSARVGDDELRAAVRAGVEGAEAKALALAEAHWKAARERYAALEHRPIWVDGDGPRERVRALLAAVCAADEDGLRPADYDTSRLEAALEAARGAPEDPKPLADVELAATALFLRLGNDLAVGRIAPDDARWNIPPRTFDPAAALNAARGEEALEDTLASLRPKHPEYEALKKALARLRELEAAGGWPTVPKGKALEPGTRDPRIQAVRARLLVTGELAEADAPEPELYDEALAQAVRTFQERHGLEPDAVIGGETVRTLNVPVEKRIDQLVANLERWRWMPDTLGERVLLVNVPSFELEAREGGAVKQRMRIIAGLPDWETPVFESEISQVAFKPQWTVPSRILSEEILPKLQEDGTFAAKAGLRVYDEDGEEVDPLAVDWTTVDPEAGPIPYRFRQPPSGRNPLGHVKFLMPNPYAIYLHDTPDDRLFGKAYRSFSHGCVRVERPVELTQFVLDGTEGWSDVAIQQEFETRGRGDAVKPAAPPKVYVTYFTAFVDEHGVLQLRTDLYRRDRAITWLLSQVKPEVEEAPALCG